MISIIIPTTGRQTLCQAMLSLSCQLQPGDEILVVSDGPSPEARRLATATGLSHSFYESDYPEHNCGHRCGNACRNFAMPLARGDDLAFLDDDDIFLPGALAAIRENSRAFPDRPLVFRMVTARGQVLWKQPALQFGNIGTPMLVVPNNPARLGQWGDRSGGDFTFAATTAALYPPDALVWREEIICLCRPTG